MYKVFIDNIPKIYQLNTESELFEAFSDHDFVEAAGGIVQRKDRFLFIKRNGVWDIPKGKLDKGEAVKSAAIREIEEECGLLDPEILEHLIDTWHTYEHKGKKVLKKTYWFWLLDKTTRELVPQAEEGITEVAYILPTEFGKIKDNTFLSIMEVIEELEKKIKC